MRPIDKLGEDAGENQWRLGSQPLDGFFGLFGRRTRADGDQGLATVQHFTSHAEQRALLEPPRVFVLAFPQGNPRIGLVALADRSAPNHGPVAQLCGLSGVSADAPGIVRLNIRAALAFGPDA